MCSKPVASLNKKPREFGPASVHPLQSFTIQTLHPEHAVGNPIVPRVSLDISISTIESLLCLVECLRFDEILDPAFICDLL